MNQTAGRFGAAILQSAFAVCRPFSVAESGPYGLATSFGRSARLLGQRLFQSLCGSAAAAVSYLNRFTRAPEGE